MKKFLIGLLLFVFYLNSCEEEKKPQIVFSICNFEDYSPMTEAIVEGCKQGIKEDELSKSYDIVLDRQIYQNDTAKFGEEFLKLGNSANFRLIKGIMVKPRITKKVENIINQVALNGGIVFTFENDFNNSLRYSYFGPDYYQIGRIAAEECTKLGDTLKKVVVLTTNYYYSEFIANQGFYDYYPYKNYPYKTAIAVYQLTWDKNYNQEVLETISGVGDFDCVFIINTLVFDGNYSLPDKLKSKFVITIGGFPSQYEDLKSGKIDVIIAYNPFVIGRKMIKSMIDLSLLNKEPNVMNIEPLEIVTSANADEWFKIWE